MAIALRAGQTASVDLGSISSGNLVLPAAPVAGNFVVVGIATFFSSTAVSSVTDSNGNAYTKSPASPVTVPAGQRNDSKAYIFYLKDAPANASATLVINNTVTVNTTAFAAEYTGVDKSSPFLNENTHSDATSSTNINDPSITPSFNNSLLFGCACVAEVVTAVTSPWIIVGAVRAGNAAEYTIQTTAAAQALGMTQSPAGHWTSIVAAFRVGGAATPQIVSATATTTSSVIRGLLKDRVVSATATTTTVLNKLMPKTIAAIATSTSNLVKRAFKRLSDDVVTSAFVSAFKTFIGSTNVVINATSTTTSTVSKRVFHIINAIVTAVSFSGRKFNVTLNAIVNTAILLVSSTQKIIFSFGKNIIQALDQNLFATRRTIFAYQEEELITAPDDFSGTFICDVDVGAGLWSGASGTFTVDFDSED